MARGSERCSGTTLRARELFTMSRSLGWHHNLAADLVAVCYPSKFASGFREFSRI